MLVQKSPRFHQIVSTKRSKSKKFPWWSMPPGPPSLPHALHTDTYLPPLGQKAERNPEWQPTVLAHRIYTERV